MPMQSLTQVERLQGLIWDAAHDASYQIELLDAAKKWLGGSNATLSIRDPANPQSATFQTLVWDPVLLPQYIEEIADEPWLAEGIRRGFCGSVLGSDLVPKRVYRRTRFFADVMGPLDVGDCVSCGVAGHERVEAFMTVNRGVRQQGFDASQLKQMQQLERSFLNSARVHLTRRATLGVQPSVLIDVNGVVDDDAAALSALQRVGMHGLESGRLVTGRPELDAHITQWLLAALAGQPNSLLSFTHARADNALEMVRVTVLPERWLTQTWAPRYGARIFVEQATDVVAQAASRFGLTPRESEVLAALSAGANVAEIADNSQRSASTVRSQLKAIFRKTGAHSQAELLRLVRLR